ncbi:MAG TPA: hypothetical protein PKD37_03615 [Oligoflexia bacterium]|nr:hypothetical protein [Oligoflexia bacterium]HMP27055.1 hypothetical protein [Oligoflexia bacterium]
MLKNSNETARQFRELAKQFSRIDSDLKSERVKNKELTDNIPKEAVQLTLVSAAAIITLPDWRAALEEDSDPAKFKTAIQICKTKEGLKYGFFGGLVRSDQELKIIEEDPARAKQSDLPFEIIQDVLLANNPDNLPPTSILTYEYYYQDSRSPYKGDYVAFLKEELKRELIEELGEEAANRTEILEKFEDINKKNVTSIRLPSPTLAIDIGIKYKKRAVVTIIKNTGAENEHTETRGVYSRQVTHYFNSRSSLTDLKKDAIETKESKGVKIMTLGELYKIACSMIKGAGLESRKRVAPIPLRNDTLFGLKLLAEKVSRFIENL